MLNIARNASIDTVRSKGFQNSRANSELTENVYESAGSVETKTDTIGLRKVVAQLKDEWRVLVELSYFQGYTQDEIAGMLQIPLGTVKTRMRSALQQLSKQLKEK
jgi:RNA polymerase sigma-70 factor (ECF subfamily)